MIDALKDLIPVFVLMAAVVGGFVIGLVSGYHLCLSTAAGKWFVAAADQLARHKANVEQVKAQYRAVAEEEDKRRDAEEWPDEVGEPLEVE